MDAWPWGEQGWLIHDWLYAQEKTTDLKSAKVLTNSHGVLLIPKEDCDRQLGLWWRVLATTWFGYTAWTENKNLARVTIITSSPPYGVTLYDTLDKIRTLFS